MYGTRVRGRGARPSPRGGKGKREGVGIGRRLGRHLSRCDVCREEAARLDGEERLIRAAFADLPVAPGFTAGVLDRIRRTVGPLHGEAGEP